MKFLCFFSTFRIDNTCRPTTKIMKTIPIFLLNVLFLTTLSTFSQSFAPIGAEWHYNKDDGRSPARSQYYHYTVTKDTLYAGKNARKIEIEEFRYSGDSSFLAPMFVFSRNDSVFYYNHLYQRYLLLYDFTAKAGDTLFFPLPDTSWITHSLNDSLFRVMVDSVSFLTINNKTLKKFHSRPLDNYSFFGGYSEFIGSEFLMLPQYLTMLPEHDGPLRCYQDSAIYIKFSTEDCDHRLTVSSLEENVLSEQIQIHPNPASSFLKIKLNNVQLGKIELLDLQGKLVKEFPSDNLRLDLKDPENGTYFLQLTTRNHNRITKKVIVQH